MAEVAYTVTATFPDDGVAVEYIAWLQGGHVGHVMAHGAISGVILRVQEPPEPIRVVARYLFPNQGAYREYVERYAPALRGEGLERFGGRPGVGFERQVAVVVAARVFPNKAQ